MVPPRYSVVQSSEHDPLNRERQERPGPGSDAREPEATGTSSGLPPNIATLPSADRREKLRTLEAVLFAAAEPLDEERLAARLGLGPEVATLLEELKGFYASRGVNLVRVAGKWAFRTATDLAYLLEQHATEERRLSKAALETLAIIAYHQPVTRAEIEEVRGVTTSKGTLDVLLETGWIRPRGRRRAPGKPITYGTTDAFLVHFGMDSIKELPGLAELKAAGLLDSNLPPDFKVPEPNDVAALLPDELPLDADEADEEQEEMMLLLAAQKELGGEPDDEQQ
jgi:segregation and condensation protein B